MRSPGVPERPGGQADSRLRYRPERSEAWTVLRTMAALHLLLIIYADPAAFEREGNLRGSRRWGRQAGLRPLGATKAPVRSIWVVKGLETTRGWTTGGASQPA
jgi:hypothetical protein